MIFANGSLVPNLPAQLKVIDESAADNAYAFGCRIGSWDVHTGARSFLVGGLEERNDGSVSYVERDVKANWSLLLFATTTLSSTVELVTTELGNRTASADACQRVSRVPFRCRGGAQAGSTCRRWFRTYPRRREPSLAQLNERPFSR